MLLHHTFLSCQFGVLVVLLLLLFLDLAPQCEADVHTNETVADGFSPTQYTVTASGIVKVLNVTDVAQVVNDLAGPQFVGLLFVYDPSCKHSRSLREKLEDAQSLLSRHWANTTDHIHEFHQPLILQSNDLPAHVDRVPALFVVTMAGGRIHRLEYNGVLTSGDEIFRTLLLYFYRLVAATNEVAFDDYAITVYPPRFPSLPQAQEFILNHSQFFFEYSRSLAVLPQALKLDGDHRSYAEWLFTNDAGSSILGDDFVMLFLCRKNDEGVAYDSFDGLSQELAHVPRVFFFIIADCEGDGDVTAVRLPDKRGLESNLEERHHCIFDAQSVENADDMEANMVQFVVRSTAPTLLWYDRERTAPIAFPRYRQVHVVLFVNMHEFDVSNPQSIHTRMLLHELHRNCRQHRENFCHDMVCLVIPSTEVRILSTLGADIWTPLEESAFNTSLSKDIALPQVLITDQRIGGNTLRYYMNRDSSLTQFMDDYWKGQLTATIRNSKQDVNILDSDIRLVNSASLKRTYSQKDTNEHLVVFFTSPTCGHCKRFSVVMTEFAALLKRFRWDSFIKVYQMDVTTDDVHPDLNITVTWTPDLYYISPNRQKPIRFDEQDDFGNDVGRLNTAMEVLTWFINEADLATSVLERMISML